MEMKLKILCEAGVIDDDTRIGVLTAWELVSDEFGIPRELEQLNMAMTHLANTVSRIKQGIPIAKGLDPEIMKEIKQDDYYPEIKKLNDTICQIVGISEVPAEENSFLLSNLYSLYLL